MREKFAFCTTLVVGLFLTATMVYAVVPGTGVRFDAASDDFENPNWTIGDRWHGSFRGIPEVLERVATPAGGKSGSSGSLRVRSYDNGDDGTPTQEDFLTQNYTHWIGRSLTRADLPSITARFYMPDISTWTFNDHNTVGLRAGVDMNFFGAPNTYWPAIWFKKQPLEGGGYEAQIRARTSTGDMCIKVIQHTTPAWYTVGMSWDANGYLSYYARCGTDDLTVGDGLYTDPYAEMTSVKYHFLSLGYPAGPEISADVIVDDISLYTVSPVPEPATLGLLAVGGLAMLRRKKNRQSFLK